MLAVPSTREEELDLTTPASNTSEEHPTVFTPGQNYNVDTVEISVYNSKKKAPNKNDHNHAEFLPASSVLNEIPPLVKPSSNLEEDSATHSEQHWNSSLQNYYTGIAVSPKKLQKDMNRAQSPGAVLNKYLKKSPSNDSGTSSARAVESPTNESDRRPPLRQRSLSGTSTASLTPSSSASGSLDQVQNKQKPKSGFSSLRFLKAMRRPSLLNLDKTQSLPRNTKPSKSANIIADNSSITGAATTTGSSSKGLKSLRNSFRAVKNFLPSKSNKGDTSSSKKASSTTNSDSNLPPPVHTEDNGSSTSTISYSAPNTPKTHKRSETQEKSITDKKLKGAKSVSTSNLSGGSWSGEEGAVKVSNLDAEKVVDSVGKRRPKEREEQVRTKKPSFLKNLTKRMRRKSQDIDTDLSISDKKRKESSDSDSRKQPDSASLSSRSKSQEILRLDNEPRVRTAKTVPKMSESQERDRELGEMEVTEKAVEVEGQQHKSSKKDKTFSSELKKPTKEIQSATEEKGQGKRKNSKEKQFPITSAQINDGSESEIQNQPEPETATSASQEQEQSNDGDQQRNKRKSWSQVVIVGSSSCSLNNDKDNNGTLLETKLDQDEREVKVTDVDNCPDPTPAEQAQSSSNYDAHPQQPQMVHVPNSNVEVTSQPTLAANASGNGTESQHVEDLEVGKEIEDEESSCTESFKQLNPFDFNAAHVEKGKRERLYKVLVVGELGSGKTSIIKRYVHQFFSQHYRATIGVDFALKVLRWDGDTVVRLQLWDIAGQERFGSMTRVYYKEAVGAFVVFDVTRSATLEAVPKWKADLDSKVALPDGRSIPTVLLANKSDQPKEGISANRDKMNEFCQQQGFSAWFETSAKDNINIDEAANFLVSKILEMDRWSQEPIASDPDKVDLANANGKHKPNTSKNCAC